MEVILKTCFGFGLWIQKSEEKQRSFIVGTFGAVGVFRISTKADSDDTKIAVALSSMERESSFFFVLKKCSTCCTGPPDEEL